MFNFFKKKETTKPTESKDYVNDFMNELKSKIDKEVYEKKKENDLIAISKERFGKFNKIIVENLNKELKAIVEYREQTCACYIRIEKYSGVHNLKPSYIKDILSLMLKATFRNARYNANTTWYELNDSVDLQVRFVECKDFTFFIRGEENMNKENAIKICDLINGFFKNVDELKAYSKEKEA